MASDEEKSGNFLPSSDDTSDSEREDGGPATGTEDPGTTSGGAPVDRVPVYVRGPTAVDVTPDRDGGVTKEIIRPGYGDERPGIGDTVYVHYVGSLTDGTKFDSSRDRGDRFKFTLGTGAVIKAWDMAVAAMTRSEVCIVQCTAKYGYGKRGSKPKIPPNATLVFEIELFDWKGEDISESLDDGILRSKLSEGDGYQTPNDMSTCNVHIKGKYGDRIFEDRDVTFVVGEADAAGVTAGVEQVVKKSKQGARSKVVVKAKYAYGSEGNREYNIPPDADLEYEVELKSFEPLKDSWKLNFKEKLEHSENLKNKGTDFFKVGKFKRAISYYEKIIEYLKDEEKLDDETDANSRHQLLLAAHLNTAMSHLKLQDDGEARSACDSALKVDPKSEKGLFRRGTANLNLRNYEDALADFKAVLDLDPDNKAAKNQLAIAAHKIKQIKENEKKTYAGMFEKFADEDAKKAEKLQVWKDGDKQEKTAESDAAVNAATDSGDHSAPSAQ